MEAKCRVKAQQEGPFLAQTRSPAATTSAASGLASSLQDLLTWPSFTLSDLLDFEE